MAVVFEWEENTFELNRTYIAKYAYLGSEAVLKINNSQVFKRSGYEDPLSKRINEYDKWPATIRGEFIDRNGKKHKIVVREFRDSRYQPQKYRVLIDSDVVSEGDLIPENVGHALSSGLLIMIGSLILIMLISVFFLQR